MKKIINGKKYDTETARKVGEYTHGYPRDFSYYCEELYCKKTGEYFLYGEGGPSSPYSHAVSCNEWSGGSKIIPSTYDEARTWAEKHLDADEYEAEFGEVSDDDSTVALSVSMSSSTADKLRRSAKKKGITISALVIQLVNNMD